MAISETSNKSKSLATFCAKVAEDKIASNITILDLSNIEFAPSDYFVICTADSHPQVDAIVWEIVKKVKEAGGDHPKIEGLEASEWVLLDYFDVVIHVFIKYARAYYQLEKLWGDGTFYKISEAGRLKKMTNEEISKIIRDAV